MIIIVVVVIIVLLRQNSGGESSSRKTNFLLQGVRTACQKSNAYEVRCAAGCCHVLCRGQLAVSHVGRSHDAPTAAIRARLTLLGTPHQVQLQRIHCNPP
jgi:hypothetical protein